MIQQVLSLVFHWHFVLHVGFFFFTFALDHHFKTWLNEQQKKLFLKLGAFLKSLDFFEDPL